MRTRNPSGFLENVFSSNKSGMEKSPLWSCVRASICWERTEHADSALQKVMLPLFVFSLQLFGVLEPYSCVGWNMALTQ